MKGSAWQDATTRTPKTNESEQDDEIIRKITRVVKPGGTMSEPTLGELLHEKSVLEREHASITTAIRELRERARAKSITASDTRISLPQSEIEFWQRGIAGYQADLMEIQGRIGALNKQ